MTKDDLDYLRPFQQYREYPAWLQSRITESENYIDSKRQAELMRAKRRLRVVASLLVLALLALIAAGYSWINANNQKKIADEQAARATDALAKSNKSQAEKSLLDFENLASRAQVIINNSQGCPRDILTEMKAIAASHPESSNMQKTISTIELSSNCRQ